MPSKLYISIVCLIIALKVSYAQEADRFQVLENNLKSLAETYPGMKEELALDINVTNVSLANFLIAVSEVHSINLHVDPTLSQVPIINNFSDVVISDLLLFLCKEHNLDIDITGNILAIKPYVPIAKKPRESLNNIAYEPYAKVLTLEVENQPLQEVFRTIMSKTGKNLLFSRGLESIPLTSFQQEVPLDNALENLAFSNNLSYAKSREGYYLFSALNEEASTAEVASQTTRPTRKPMLKRTEQYYEILDTLNQIVTVQFQNAKIGDVINDLTQDLNINYFIASPLDRAGVSNLKIDRISFDSLLEKLFSDSATTLNGASAGNQPTPSQSFTFKKENGIYYFGTEEQLSVRDVEIVQLMHRSVELLDEPSTYAGSRRSAGRTVPGGINYINTLGNGPRTGTFPQTPTREAISTASNNTNASSLSLLSIVPQEILAPLQITTDAELNSFVVNGSSQNIDRFKSFIKTIDKPVPVILIEVMIVEVNKTARIDAGVSFGLGEEPTNDSGEIFPNTGLTIGAETINRVIGNLDGFGSLDIGKVVPNFYATIRALEANGNIKIRSTPKLSTLNGHRANLSIGETTYYVVVNQNIYGSQIPQATEFRNYQPIDAELAVSIKPLVSGDGQITLDINVVQSDFNGERIEEDAPPGINSREFSSIIRVQENDIVILGGLEEKIKNDSGSGVPLLSKIPVLKWLFSNRVREDSKKKLTVLIKPTVLY